MQREVGELQQSVEGMRGMERASVEQWHTLASEFKAVRSQLVLQSESAERMERELRCVGVAPLLLFSSFRVPGPPALLATLFSQCC